MGRLITAIISVLLALPLCAAAAPEPKNVAFGECGKTFAMPAEKLFYLTIASANANRFKIDEIQSKKAYVVFIAADKAFLAAVSRIDKNNSFLRITPADNSYYFAPEIVRNVFKYIEINAAQELKTLPPRG